MGPLKRIAIFAATSWEIDAVRAALPSGVERHVDGVRAFVGAAGEREYWLVRTGVGLAKASRVASRVLTHRTFCLAVSTGFACSLIKADIGALLLGHDAVMLGPLDTGPAQVIDVPGMERDLVTALLTGEVPPGHQGRFVSVDRIVDRASEKEKIARATGAIGLDMESAALAVEARRAQVPFVIVRAVSDLLDEDLPLDFNLFLRPTGWIKGIATLLGAPSSLLGLGRLRRQSLTAATNLTSFFRRYIAMMAAEDGAIRQFTGTR